VQHVNTHTVLQTAQALLLLVLLVLLVLRAPATLAQHMRNHVHWAAADVYAL
jgi:hypothetical protein